jgi:hypothetical protein
MKSSPVFYTRSFAVVGIMVLAASPAWAVIPFSWATNGSGTVLNGDGSWTGSGAIQPNLDPVSTTAQIAVQNFSSGTMVINKVGGSATGNAYSAGRLLSDPLSLVATHTITLTGGTADLRLHNSNSNDGGAALFNSVGLTDFQGVTEITWTTTYNQPLAGRNTDLTGGQPLTSRPMGEGLALITAGSGQSVSSFTVDLDFDQIYHEVGGEFVSGVPVTAIPRQNPGFGGTGGYGTAGATSFTSSAFVALNQFLLVRGYDMDNNGIDATDMTKVYMRQMTWTIRKDDNSAFSADTLFTMSMDGQQYSNYLTVIPEPTSVLLVGGSVLGGCLLRRRRA